MVFSMFGGGGNGPELRPMEQKDRGGVLRIIAQHDEDDFAEARDDLSESMAGIYVMADGSKIIGVTGGVPDPHTDDIAWLSWTYVDVDRQGQGIGRAMFQAMTTVLKQADVRKLFINTSDYVEDGEDVYAPARAFYEKMGAKLEVTMPDYHAAGEARLTYGLSIGPGAGNDPQPAGGALRFVDIEELDESDGGLGLVWEEVEGAADPSSIEPGLDRWVAEATKRRARILYAAVPSDLCANLNGPLATAGFEHHGRLLDYFAPNIHQELGSLKL